LLTTDCLDNTVAAEQLEGGFPGVVRCFVLGRRGFDVRTVGRQAQSGEPSVVLRAANADRALAQIRARETKGVRARGLGFGLTLLEPEGRDRGHAAPRVRVKVESQKLKVKS